MTGFLKTRLKSSLDFHLNGMPVSIIIILLSISTTSFVLSLIPQCPYVADVREHQQCFDAKSEVELF